MKIKQQAGLSTLGLIFVIGVFAFIVITALKVIPIYMEFYQVQTVVKALAKDQTVNLKSKRDIWTAISKRLRVNNIRTLTQKNFEVTREDKVTSVHINYEVRNPYVANMFIGATFEKTIVLDKNAE